MAIKVGMFKSILKLHAKHIPLNYYLTEFRLRKLGLNRHFLKNEELLGKWAFEVLEEVCKET